jgi:hypothetical protein
LRHFEYDLVRYVSSGVQQHGGLNMVISPLSTFENGRGDATDLGVAFSDAINRMEYLSTVLCATEPR